MPELPEVENTVRYMRERILGSRVSDARISWNRTLSTGSPAAFASGIAGRVVYSVERRGKYFIIALKTSGKKAASPSPSNNGSLSLVGHLRMSGRIVVESSKAPRSKHERVAIIFSNGQELRFIDVRKFGRLYLVKDPMEITRKLGPEPLDRTFSATALFQQLKDKKGAIKPLLLNQSFIAGIGNIYADEALWSAKIHPLKAANRVSQKKVVALHSAIKRILNKAIESRGTDNGDNVIDGGLYNPRAYGREGLGCYRCKRIIKRIVVGQRGTHFCPNCQR